MSHLSLSLKKSLAFKLFSSILLLQLFQPEEITETLKTILMKISSNGKVRKRNDSINRQIRQQQSSEQLIYNYTTLQVKNGAT